MIDKDQQETDEEETQRIGLEYGKLIAEAARDFNIDERIVSAIGARFRDWMREGGDTE